MEGHESSDWNSYYADTQEVRSGQQAGPSRSPCRGRPGEAGAGPGGRLAPGGASSGPSLRVHPRCSRTGLGRALETDPLPRGGGWVPAFGAWSGPEGFRKLWPLKAPALESACLFSAESGSRNQARGAAGWRARAGKSWR